MMMEAKLLKHDLAGFQGSANLYQVDPPLDGHEYVVVSAAMVPFSGPETYIFPASKEGIIYNFGELEGSYRGGLDHEIALKNAGYTTS